MSKDIVKKVVEKLHAELKNNNLKWSKFVGLSEKKKTLVLEIKDDNYKKICKRMWRALRDGPQF